MRTGCAAHHKKFDNACMVKKGTFCKDFAQNAKDSPGLFPDAVILRFSLKEWVLGNSTKLTGNPLYWILF